MGRNGLSYLLQEAALAEFEEAFPANTLDRAFDFAYFGAISEGLEAMYGQKGGRGIALRVGMATFAEGMRHFGIFKGMQSPIFRSLPLENRVDLGLNALASVLTHFSDQRCWLQQDETSVLLYTDNCPFAYGRTSDRPTCHAMVGIIQECLRWASNGYEFRVREVQCRTCGDDSCVFRINKTAFGENGR